MKRKNWTIEEIHACLDLYRFMRQQVDAGQRYNKAALIRQAQAHKLSERTRGAIESKMMNITAILRELGCDHLSMELHGYKALCNYQQSLKQVIAEALGMEVVNNDNAQIC